MIVDARTLPSGASLTSTVCVIGGGPAGLTLADRLTAAGLDIVLLESGGLEPHPDAQALNDGDLVGEPFVFEGTPQQLADTRLRYLGGTSNHWTGMCRPLDEHDFTARDGVPGSGWPITAGDLRTAYERAAATCGLASTRWDAAWWQDTLSMPSLTDGLPALTTAVHQFSPPVRFGEALRPALEEAPSTRVLLWANATELVPSRDGRHVDHVQVRTLAGNDLTVRADVVVVAAGGIESARLLLASDQAAAGGLGNGHDLVGRTFMEHPHVIGGRAQLDVPAAELGYHLLGSVAMPPDGAPQHVWAGLAVAPDGQAAAGIGSGTVLFWPAGEGPPRGDRDVPTEAAAAAASLAAPSGGTATALTLAVRTEQQPNPDSRVTLQRRRDALGMRRVAVDWQLTDGDWRTVEETVRLVAIELGRAGLGRVEVAPGGRSLRSFQVGVGNHHMGTVRMHEDPALGVVDADCRVHEVDDLYVCSSAVFTTSGAANPTLTIVALAHRLADHLIAGR